MVTNSQDSIFASAVEAALSQDNTNVYIVTKNVGDVAESLAKYLDDNGQYYELVNKTAHIYFFTLGGQRDLFVCEKAGDFVTTIFEV